MGRKKTSEQHKTEEAEVNKEKVGKCLAGRCGVVRRCRCLLIYGLLYISYFDINVISLLISIFGPGQSKS